MDSFSMNEGSVACRQLGYTGVEQVVAPSVFGSGSGTIWLDNLQCIGVEQEISSCQHDPYGVHNCNDNDQIGLVCSELQ